MGKWTNDNMNANVNLPDVSGEDMYGGDYVTDSNDTRDAVQFRLDTINNYQPPETPSWTPESGGEAPRAWDIHYTPSWFIEEQANRKNPTYQADQNWSNEQVDAIANYVSGKKSTNPREWKYGDPGWSIADPLWTDFIKPAEDAYQSTQRPLQGGVQASKPSQTEAQPQVESKPSYYSYHNNKMNTAPDTTALATVQNGTNNAPIRTTDEVAKIKEGAPYKLHQVDTSGADYNNLATSGKIVHNVMPANAGSDVKNQKWYQRWTAPIAGSVMSGSGPAGIAKFVATAVGSPIAGLISGIAWAASTGYSYLRGTGKIQGNEKIDKFLELTDILDKKGAQFQGALARGWEKAGGGDLTDWSKFDENMDFFVRNIDTIMHYGFGKGRGSKEYNPEVWGMISSMTPNIGANVVGIEGQGASRTVLSALSQIFDKPEDKIWLERNQTTRANAGLEGVYEIPEELLGTNAITYWADYAQYLYDNGITNMSQLEYEVSTEMAKVYGDLFNTSEFIEHEIGDPGNVGENMQSRVLYGVGKVTGDTNLANAAKANTGSLIGDLTGNIPVIPDAARFVAKLFGNNEFLKTSGGIDEVVNTWDMTNLKSTDPSNLTARDRRLSGINDDGSLKSLDPLKNPNTIKNPFERGAERIKQLFQTTNEWRASMAGDSIMNFISTGIEDAMSARPEDDAQTRIDRVTKFVDELEHPETISADSPFSEPSKTILFNSIKEDLSMAVRQNRQAIDKVITDYANLEPNRQVLNTLAEALNMTPDKVMSKYENEKTVLAQMIINKADENGGTIPSIKFADGTPIPVDSRAFGDHVISMLAPFAGKDAKPYAPQALMTQITSKIGDGVTETLLNKYGIQPEGWVYRFGDTIKKLQHLWLLGLSPSYLANNVVNNVLTRSALGYGGFLTPMAINKFTDRFGYTPERFTESMAEGILESKKNEKRPSEKMREAIRAKRKGTNKFLDKVDSKLDWVSEHAGLFGAISGKIEELESKQIYASAMMTYMARTWKPGVNFRKMDPQLENLIRSQNPDMVDAIYSAVSSGMNMKEIENAIYGSFVIPSIRDSLVDAARNLGFTNAEDAVVEIFDKAGVMEELKQALNGKRGDEIDAVLAKVRERLEKYAKMKLNEDLARRADQIAKDTNGYSFAEAIKLGQDLASDMGDLWLESQNANTQLFDRRLREGMSAKEFHDLYQSHQNTMNEQWKGIYRTAEQTYLGILNGLGFDDQTANKYVDMMRTKDGLWSKFYEETQPELFQPYLDALVWQTEDDFAKWDSRVRKAYKDYIEASNNAYQKVIAEEQKQQIAMDKVFADGLKDALGNVNEKSVNDVIIPLQEEIRNIRQQIIDLNLAIRAKTDKTNVLNEKSQTYHENDARRTELKEQYREAQQKLYDAIRVLGPQTEAPANDSVLTETDPAATIRNDIAKREAERAKQIYEENANTDADDIDETGDIPDDVDDAYRKILREELEDIRKRKEELQSQIDALVNENNLEKNVDELKRLNNERVSLNLGEARIEQQLSEMSKFKFHEDMEIELNRKNLYKTAKELGSSDEEAVAYAQINKARANEWEANHPGKKFFRDAGGMTVKAVNEEQTASGAGLYQAAEVTDDLKSLLNEKYELQKLANTIYKHTDYVTLSDAIEEVARYRKLSDEIFNLYDVSIYKGATASSLPLYKFKEATDFTNAVMNDIGMMPYSTKGLTDAGLSEKLNKNVNESYASLVALNNALENFLYDQKHGYTSQKLSKSQVLGLFGMEDNDQLYYRPSELIEAYTGTEEFQNFYGDAPEMRDENGDPIVVYHGGRDNTLTYFDTEKRGSNAGGYDTKEAFYFTKSPIAAGSYGRNTNDNALELIARYLNNVRRVDLDYDISQYNSTSEAIDGALSDIRKALESLDIDPTHSESLYNDILTMYDDLHKKYDNGDYTLDDLAKDYDFAEFANAESAIRYLQDYGQYVIEEYNQAHPKADWYAKPYYLSIKNPYVVDYQGKRWSDLTPIIKEAKKGGHDGVIINNIQDGGRVISTDYLIFKANQAKSIYNEGPFSLDTKNVYRQEQQQRIKGQFTIEDGKKIATLFQGSDFSTLVHETMGHGWVTTLNDNQIEALAAYNGWTPERYRQLENQWYYDPKSMNEADRTAWVDSQEKFAYGFEQYLLEGKAPNSAMAQLFESFKRFLTEIYRGVRHLLYKGEAIDIHKEQHGVTLAEIFDSLLVESDREFNIDRTGLEDVQSNSIEDNGSYGRTIPENIREYLMSDMAKRGEKINTMKADAEASMRLETQTFLDENKKWALNEAEQIELVTEIMHELGLNMDLPEDPVLMASVQEKMSKFPGGEKAVRRFIDTHRETAAKISDSAMMDGMLKNSQFGDMNDVFKYVLQQVETPEQVKKTGDFVVPTKEFTHGAYKCDRVVYHDGQIVAYLPVGQEQTTIEAGNGKTAQIIGISVQHPDQQMYLYDGEVFEAPKPQKQTDNIFYGDAESDSLGALDPEAQANQKITFEQVLPILDEFGRVYKTSLNDAMANKTFGSLDAKTKELVRQYIDNDVRTDLMNTKYKTGKFGEMMRDAALLNYSKRYGFDNAMTLLFPYQFWQTRSAWNWLQRMGGKGGKMWRRYARLKELEERNKKELLPSKVTGKIGIYLPFLPEWMGDALFMPTSQLSIIGNFLDPLDDWVTDNKAVTATAERYIQEAFDAGDISYPEFLDAMDPAKRAGSAVWQEMFARAQTEGDHDRDLGNLFKQYFGMSLPVSIGKALITGNPDDWTQTPMSRTGTAFRAMLGDNIFGKGIEFAMSAPERAMRKAAVAITGNNDFRYQEFGNFGDYYIRNQLWDMVVEGKISAEDAITAHIEKDGNKYWDQAAERQRLELLEKTQLLSTTMPFKKMVEDIRNGNQDKLGDDLKYLFAEILTTWTPTTVVRDAERTWRGQSAELSKLYETNDKEGREKFYDENPNYTYKNLRYEADPEQALRSYLYKSINNVWYDLSPAEKAEIKMALGPDFEKSIISKETRAYQTMDIDKLAAYAQALNGSIPYLATEKLNTMNVPKIDTNFIPEPLMNAYDTFRAERDRLYPGMADVDQIYYSLPADQRKIFANANPKLVEYQKWSSQYKKDHPEVKEFSNLQSDYYDMKEAEEVFAMMDKLTLKALTTAAYSGKDVDKDYQKLIEQYMLRSGSTKKYKDFVKNLTDYILGVQ